MFQSATETEEQEKDPSTPMVKEAMQSVKQLLGNEDEFDTQWSG
jgi:hypothetical protein